VSNELDASVIEKIRKTHENMAVVIGFAFGCILSAYFFTFSMFVDQGRSGLLWFQGISSVVIIVLLFKLKHVAFFFTRIWLARRREYREALAQLTVADLSREAASQ